MRDGQLSQIVLDTLHTEVITHFHFCAGAGGGAAGLNDAMPRVDNMQARFECLGGIDVDPGALANFERFTGAKGTVLDLFTREQYIAFHGKQPPPGWREATPEDIRRAAGYRRPNVVVISAPCKGNSGLVSPEKAETAKYVALNGLTQRCVFLMTEAWRDEGGVDFIIFENVPRIEQRSAHLLEQIIKLLQASNMAVDTARHNCGEIGHLAQSRQRFLLVARNLATIPNFIYQPERKPLRGVGEVLGRMPLPGDPRGGRMHRIPQLQFKTWCRLAFVTPGSDWRSLNRLAVEDGVLRDYLLMPERRADFLGVNRWDEPCGALSGRSGPTNGSYAVADPRHAGAPKHSNEFAVGAWSKSARTVTSAHGTGQCVADPRFQQSEKWQDGQAYGVRAWDEPAGAIAGQQSPGQQSPGQGGYTVADPRVDGVDAPAYHYYRIVERQHGAADTGAAGTASVADPRGPDRDLFAKYAVTEWKGSTGTVIGGCDSGAYAVADPRSGLQRGRGSDFLTAGHYGVVPWNSPSGAVSAAASHDNGRHTVADPRVDALYPAANQKTVAVIITPAGNWHRPFTTLELAALQSIFDPAEVWSDDPAIQAEIDERNRRRGWDGYTMIGTSDRDLREQIGNMIPRKAAKAVGEEVGMAILLARSGTTFMLSSKDIWVRPHAVAIAARGGHMPFGALC